LIHFGSPLILPFNIKHRTTYLALNAVLSNPLLAHCFITVNNLIEMHQNNSLG